MHPKDDPPLGKLLKQRSDWSKLQVHSSKTHLDIGGWQVMQAWEKPVMEKMAEIVTQPQGNVLEIGFGMGIAASFIQGLSHKSHTIIEGHPKVFREALAWKKRYQANTTILLGFWEDLWTTLPMFDGILFDTFPLVGSNDLEKEYYEFAVPFFPVAKKLLRKGGKFTYWTHEYQGYTLEHWEVLSRYFRDIQLYKVATPTTKETQYWPYSHIIVPEIIK